MKRFFYLVGIAVIMIACVRNPLKINVSDVDLDLRIRHLDHDLLKLNKDQISERLPELKAAYGEFFSIFTYEMIAIGGDEQENFVEMLNSFVADSMIRGLVDSVAEKVDTVFLRKELEQAFRHYRYYFPGKPIPNIYTCISGFNQSVVTSENVIGISLDKYLGAKSSYYQQLALPLYKRKNMNPVNMIPDVMYAWAMTEWPKADQSNTLLSQMIQEGKMMYFIDALLPDLHDTLKIGYSKEQLQFCESNEGRMWTYLAEHKLLFASERMSVKRFIDDGPYTSVFSDKSPARTGVWLGWQIVRSYMKQNPKVKLEELLTNSDFQAILNQSGYQP